MENAVSSPSVNKPALKRLAHLIIFGTAAFLAVDMIKKRFGRRGGPESTYRGIGTPVH